VFIPKEKTYNINPFFMLIQHILGKGKVDEDFPSNKVVLADLIESTLQPLEKECCPHFMSNYNYLVQKLRNNATSQLKYSTLLEQPLFMTLHEKEMFLVFFDNKMSEMCDEYFNKERQLRKEHKYKELREARINAMKNGIYKNHRFNFILNGLVERQLIELKICQSSNSGKLDWITEHPNLKISYEVPKNERDEVKDRAYSLNCLMQCLRGAIAHKVDHSYDIILNFNEEYPQLVDFLFARRALLSRQYERMIEETNKWLQCYFDPSDKQLPKALKALVDQGQCKQQSSQVNEAVELLGNYCADYEKKICKTLKSSNANCDRCVLCLLFRKNSSKS
jgi:hypothetical protein